MSPWRRRAVALVLAAWLGPWFLAACRAVTAAAAVPARHLAAEPAIFGADLRVVTAWTTPPGMDSVAVTVSFGKLTPVRHWHRAGDTRDTVLFAGAPAIGESATGAVTVTTYKLLASSESAPAVFGPITRTGPPPLPATGITVAADTN